MGNEAEDEYEEVDALEDSDDDFQYEEVDIEEEDDDLFGDGDEDLDAAMRSLNMQTSMVGGSATKAPEPAPGEVTKRPEVRERSEEGSARLLGVATSFFFSPRSFSVGSGGRST